MTCSQDCKHCIYGEPKTEILCKDNNVTCSSMGDGDACGNCSYKYVVVVGYKCIKQNARGILYG